MHILAARDSISEASRSLQLSWMCPRQQPHSQYSNHVVSTLQRPRDPNESIGEISGRAHYCYLERVIAKKPVITIDQWNDIIEYR